MITSVKKYGSYVLIKNSLYNNDLIDDPHEREHHPYASTCAIPSYWIELPLIKIIPYNHDTSIFRFALPQGSSELRLPVGAFLFILAPGCEHDGSDAIRPYTSITDDSVQNHREHPYESVPSFDILCKRYDEWGEKENPTKNFLFTRTDHSYRPPGAVSNYIHRLKPGDRVKFKHSKTCLGRVPYPFPGVKHLMLIAVGVGVAPMIQTLRSLLKQHQQRRERQSNQPSSSSRSDVLSECDIDLVVDDDQLHQIDQIVLFYGVRTVKDILLRDILEQWQREFADILKVVFCVGSRWNNIHFGAKKKTEYIPPPPPEGFEALKDAELVSPYLVLPHIYITYDYVALGLGE